MVRVVEWSLVAVYLLLESSLIIPLPPGSFFGMVAAVDSLIVSRYHYILYLVVFFVATSAGKFAIFLLSRRFGERVFGIIGSRSERVKEYWKRLQSFWDEKGPIAVFGLRFVPIFGRYTPILAGTSRMNTRSYLRWMLLGNASFSLVYVWFLFRGSSLVGEYRVFQGSTVPEVGLVFGILLGVLLIPGNKLTIHY